MGLGDFLEGVGQVISTGIQTLPAIIAAGNNPATQTFNIPGTPGAFPLAPLSGLANTSSALAATAAASQGAGCGQFRATTGSVRAVREIRAVNPATGKIESWTHRGSPLVWTGDRAIAKKYARNAGFTLKRRASGGSTRRRTTRRR